MLVWPGGGIGWGDGDGMGWDGMECTYVDGREMLASCLEGLEGAILSWIWADLVD